MPHINLLPWREELRLQKNKEFMTLIIMIALLAVLAVGATLFFFNNRLNDQKAANELISTRNQQLDVALKEIETLEQRKEDIIARMKVIQDLQGKRPIPVRVWDDLARAMPEMLFLTKLERKGDKLILSGKAENPNIVSVLINNLNRSHWMGDSSVQFIEKADEAKVPDKNSKEIIYPESSYVGFQVTTIIQMSGKKDTKANKNGVPAPAPVQEQQVPAVDNSVPPPAEATPETNISEPSPEDKQAPSEVQQTSDSGKKEVDTKAQQPEKPAKAEETQKASNNQVTVPQKNANESQTSDKVQKTATDDDEKSNPSQDGTTENSDETAEDSGGDT